MVGNLYSLRDANANMKMSSARPRVILKTDVCTAFDLLCTLAQPNGKDQGQLETEVLKYLQYVIVCVCVACLSSEQTDELE